MAFKAKAPGEVSEINVTPLVDVMLVLLIIFMVITPMLQSHVSVTMAKAQNPSEMRDAKKTNAAVVAVTRDNRVYLGPDQTTLGDLSAKIKDLMADKQDKTVFIKSDARAKYGTVVKVVDAIRAADLQDIGLLTEKIQGEPPGAPPAPLR